MSRSASRWGLVVLATLLLAVAATRADDCFGALPYHFPFLRMQSELGVNATWHGGDIASATRLDGGRLFWAFGDTHVGPPGTLTREPGDRFVGNTVAVSACRNGVFFPSYFYRGAPEAPRPFFEDWAAGHRFWPFRPFVHAGRLFVFLKRIKPPADVKTSVLARIANPNDPPMAWRIDYLNVCERGNPNLGDEAFVFGDHVHVYGYNINPQNAIETFASRIPLDQLLQTPDRASLEPSVQYLAKDKTWKPGVIGPDYQPVGIPTTAGFSARWHKGLSRWMVVFTESGPPKGWQPVVKAMLCPTPFGPWEPPVEIYRFPEMTPGQPEYHPDNVCEHVGERPELASDSETRIAFTYVPAPKDRNQRLRLDPWLYTPKVVEVPNPFVAAGKGGGSD